MVRVVMMKQEDEVTCEDADTTTSALTMTERI